MFSSPILGANQRGQQASSRFPVCSNDHPYSYSHRYAFYGVFIYGLIHSFIITHIARSHGPTETTQGILSPTSKALSSPKLAGSSRSSLESKNLHWAVSALKNPNESGEMGDGGSYFLLVKWGHLFKKMKNMWPTCCVGKGLSHLKTLAHLIKDRVRKLSPLCKQGTVSSDSPVCKSFHPAFQWHLNASWLRS